METLKERSDERLIALYVDGNNEAFDVLIDRHKDRVYSYILHYVKNPELADYIFQETNVCFYMFTASPCVPIAEVRPFKWSSRYTFPIKRLGTGLSIYSLADFPR